MKFNLKFQNDKDKKQLKTYISEPCAIINILKQLSIVNQIFSKIMVITYKPEKLDYHCCYIKDFICY